MASSQNLSSQGYREELLDHGDIGGYSIHARDGDLGRVDKHDADAGRSTLLVAVGPRIFGRTVALPAGVIDRIDHRHESVYVNASREEIRHSPPFDAGHQGT